MSPIVGGGGQARVRNAQDLLEFLEEYQEGAREAVLGRLEPEHRAILENSVRTAWISIDQDAFFVDAVIATFGPEGAKEMWRAYTRRFVETPFAKSLFEGTRRLLGLDVGGLARQVPRLWGQSFRDVGEMEAIAQDDDSLVVVLTEMCPALWNRPGYLLILEGMFSGLYDLAQTKPNIEVTRAPANRTATIVLQW